MKKYFIFLLVAISSSFCAMYGQYVDRSFFKAGFHAAVAVGDASDDANFGVGLDLYQHWGISRKLDLGVTAGFTNFFGLESTIDIGPDSITTRGEDTRYGLVGGFFRFYPSRSINLGGDIGYALGISSGVEGGFYYRPTISVNLSDTSALNFSYMAINSIIRDQAFYWNAVSAGVIFQF